MPLKDDRQVFLFAFVLVPSWSWNISMAGKFSFDMKVVQNRTDSEQGETILEGEVKGTEIEVDQTILNIKTINRADLEVDQKTINEEINRQGIELNHTSMEEEYSWADVHIDKTTTKVENVTAPTLVQCPYQFPEETQFNAMLSNMMNECTKLFHGAKQLVNDMVVANQAPVRFKYVSREGPYIFETLFHNISAEYRNYYINQTSPTLLYREDPCSHQDELKVLWRNLLDASLIDLRKVSVRVFEEILVGNKMIDEDLIRYRFSKFLLKELAGFRGRQIHTLCSDYQQCYDGLV